METKIREGKWAILPDNVRIRYEVDPFGTWKGINDELRDELDALDDTLRKLGYRENYDSQSGDDCFDEYLCTRDTKKPYQLKYLGKGANYKLDFIQATLFLLKDEIPVEEVNELVESFCKWVEKHLVKETTSKESNRGKNPNSRKNLSKSSKRKGKKKETRSQQTQSNS